MARKTTPLCYVTFYVRCSVFHLGYVSLYVRCSVLDPPKGGSRVLCTCTADIVLQLSARPCSDVHARGTSFFGTASCMSCFGYFVSWPGLFRFGAAETSFRGILLNDRWVDQFPLIHFACVHSFIYEKCADFGRNAINNGKADRISFLNLGLVHISKIGAARHRRWASSRSVAPTVRVPNLLQSSTECAKMLRQVCQLKLEFFVSSVVQGLSVMATRCYLLLEIMKIFLHILLQSSKRLCRNYACKRWWSHKNLPMYPL